jgi:hypothetical protein
MIDAKVIEMMSKEDSLIAGAFNLSMNKKQRDSEGTSQQQVEDDNGDSAPPFILPALPMDYYETQDQKMKSFDETEESVKEMLNLSEKLLLDLEKQLQTEQFRHQEEYRMQQLQHDTRGNGNNNQNTNQNNPNTLNKDEDGTLMMSTANDAKEGDLLLATAEIIMHNDFYHVSFLWRSRESEAMLIARNLLPK